MGSDDAYEINPNLGLWNGMAWIYKFGVADDENPAAPTEVKVSKKGLSYFMEGSGGNPALIHYAWKEVFWSEEMVLPYNVKEFTELYPKKEALKSELGKFKNLSNIGD